MNCKSRLISNKGKLIRFSISQSKDSAEVDLFDIDSGSVAKVGTALWQDSSKSRRTLDAIACVNCVVYETVLLRLPCFAVLSSYRANKGKKLTREFVLLTFFNGELSVLKRFSLPFDEGQSLETLECHLIDGPDVLLFDLHKSIFFIGHPSTSSTFQKIDLSQKSSYDLKIAGISCFAFDQWSKHLCFITFTEDNEKCSQSNDTNNYAYLIFDAKNPDVCKPSIIEDVNCRQRNDGMICMPPRSYWSLITSFKLLKSCFWCVEENEFTESKDHTKYSAITTSLKQFLVFDGCNALLCCQIPFEDCHEIVPCQLPIDDEIFILLSRSNGSCVVSAKSQSVIKEWVDVYDIFVDDFLSVGHDQILAFFDELTDVRDVEFSLTDFACCHSDSKTAGSSNFQSSSIKETSSLYSVVNALSTQVQAAILEINQNEIAIQRKNLLIKESWTTLENILLKHGGSNNASSFDGLVDLFDSQNEKLGDQRCNISSDQDTMPANSCFPFVLLEKQQAIILDKWVTLVKLRKLAGRIVRDISLCMIIDSLTSESARLPVEKNENLKKNYNHHLEIGSKKIKRKERCLEADLSYEFEAILTAKTEIPSFSHSKHCKALLMVNWLEERNEKFFNFSFLVGSVTLNAADVINGAYSSQDRLLYEAACVKTELSIRADQFSLANLGSKIEDALSSTKCNVQFRQDGKLKCNEDSEFNEHSRIIVSPLKMTNAVEIVIFARDNKDTNQICHLIGSLLPPDAQITFPDHEQNQLLSRFSASLHRELSILEKFAESGLLYLNDASSEAASRVTGMEQDDTDGKIKDLNRPFDKDRIESIRRDFQKKRKRNEALELGNSITLDAETYRKYLSAVQDTDAVATMICKLNLLQ